MKTRSPLSRLSYIRNTHEVLACRPCPSPTAAAGLPRQGGVTSKHEPGLGCGRHRSGLELPGPQTHTVDNPFRDNLFVGSVMATDKTLRHGK